MLNRFKRETSNYVHVTSSVILCLISGVSMDQLGCSAQLCLKRTKIIGFMARAFNALALQSYKLYTKINTLMRTNTSS